MGHLFFLVRQSDINTWFRWEEMIMRTMKLGLVQSHKWLLGCGLALLLMMPVVAQAKSSPMALLKTTQASIEKLLDKKIEKAEKKKLIEREKKIRAILQPFFDFRLLAERTLDKQWAKLSKEQRDEFTFWLRGLLEQAYLRGVRGNSRDTKKPDVTYKKEQIKGKKATVNTMIKFLKVTKRRGRVRKRWQRVRVDWSFEQKKSWLVVDILTNDNSLIDTYKEQFTKIIEKKSYKVLLQKISKKVNQLRKKRGLPELKWEKKG